MIVGRYKIKYKMYYVIIINSITVSTLRDGDSTILYYKSAQWYIYGGIWGVISPSVDQILYTIQHVYNNMNICV